MKLRRPVYVVGGAHTNYIGKFHPDFIWKKHPDFGKRQNPTLEDYIVTIINKTLEATGVDPSLIDKGYLGNFAGQLFSNQGHLGAMMPIAHEALGYKPLARVEAACASGGIAALASIDALQGMADVALVIGAEVQTSVSARQGADFLARASHYATERELDEFTFPCLFARRMKAYQETHGVSHADIAPVVAKAYANANKNPNAHMRTVTWIDEAFASGVNPKNPAFLRNEDYRDHLLISDCSQVSDGATGIIIATEEGLAKMGIDKSACTEIVAYGHSTSALGQVKDFTRLDNAEAAINEAYRDSGLSVADMGVGEVHDCFSVTEVLMYEALGLTGYGKGTEAAKDGSTQIDGRLPINTGGGLMAFGHPVGATGVKQIFEVHRQMKGQCGDYQMPTTPGVGLTANMGGDDRTTVVTIQRNT